MSRAPRPRDGPDAGLSLAPLAIVSVVGPLACSQIAGLEEHQRAPADSGVADTGVEASSDTSTEAESDADIDAASEPEAPPQETCNFEDDDHDGLVDEGFDWIVTPWKNVLTSKLYAANVSAVRMKDGRIAVAGKDTYGAGNDRIYHLVLAADGSVLLGPTHVPVPSLGASSVSVAATDKGEIASLFDTTDYAGCKSGCPVIFSRLDGSDLHVISSAPVTKPWTAAGATSLAWGTGGYFAALRKGPGDMHIVRFDIEGGSYPIDYAISVKDADKALLALSGNGLGWAVWASHPTPGPERGELDIGVLTVGGYAEILKPTVVYKSEGLDGMDGPLSWLGTDLLVRYKTALENHIERRTPQGAIVAERVVPDGDAGTGPFPVRALAVEGNVVLLNVDNSRLFYVERLDGQLRPIPTPGGLPTAPGTSAFMDMVPLDAGVLLVRGTYDGKTVDVAQVRCP